MGQREKIHLNPNFNLDEAFRQKRERGKYNYMITKDDRNIQLNPEHAKYDRIRSYLLGRSGRLTIVFKWDTLFERLDIGLATEWGFVYGTPPSASEEEIPFAKALYKKFQEACKMGAEAVRVRTSITGGQI